MDLNPSSAGGAASRPPNGSSKCSPLRESEHSDETTPLLARNRLDDDDDEDRNDLTRSSAASAHDDSDESPSPKRPRRWPSILALSILCVAVIAIMVGGFFAPEAVESYAMEALEFHPTKLSIVSYSDNGLKARIQGDFSMNASKVDKKPVRDIGRFATWMMREVETKPTTVHVDLPERGHTELGTAVIPPIRVNVRNGHITHVDFVAEIKPGPKDGLKSLASDWINGRLGQLRVLGKADVGLKSGIFSLPTQAIERSLDIKGDHDLPAIPAYKLLNLAVAEDILPDGNKGLVAQASLGVENQYPVHITVPPLGFQILVGGCSSREPQIPIADAITKQVTIDSKKDVVVNATGFLGELPAKFTHPCPGSEESPFDTILSQYLHGEEAVLYVRGSKESSEKTPQWIVELLSSISVPVPMAGPTLGRLIRNFNLTDVHFELPDYYAEPDSPESQPRISANIEALIALPAEASIPISVSRVRAEADVYYEGDKLGNLDLHNWQKASSKSIGLIEDGHAGLLVQSSIKDAPLNVTDYDVFSSVIQSLLAKKPVKLKIEARVDVDVTTALGQFIVRNIPAAGEVPVKPIPSGDFSAFSPKVGGLTIIETAPSYVIVAAKVNLTNPTNYSANVPYASINILVNGTVLGHVTTESLSLVPGENTNIQIKLTWEPGRISGRNGTGMAKEFLSQWLTGYNTSMTLQTYEGSFPAAPALGKGLRFLTFDIPTPHFKAPTEPGDGDDHPRFVRQTTLHLFSSTAEFDLVSPLAATTIYITHLNATSYYEGEVAGKIVYDQEFPVPPGESKSPKMPVDWSVGSKGKELLRKAIGNTLKLDAYAIVGLRIDEYEVTVWFAGKGIGARVQI